MLSGDVEETAAMKKLILFGLFYLCVWFCLFSAGISAADLPDLVVPDALGIHIHFTDPLPGELDMFDQLGFRWVRRGLNWNATEPAPGRYDFSEYDKLMAALQARHIRPILFFSYRNSHYDNGLPPRSDAGRQAFARWAVAAVERYRNRGVLWEMYNEPNNPIFWNPKVNAEDYIKLALEVGKAIRKADSKEAESYIGPAAMFIDLPFLEKCFKAGLLEYWSAVSVHPYIEGIPEKVGPQYAKLRKLIDQYAPKSKHIPILSAEWGYPSVWKSDLMNEEMQAVVLPRELLVNLANGIPLSIWYVWRDVGVNPKDPQHHFGLVRHPYSSEQTPVYQPKPAFFAAKTLLHTLDGHWFQKRLAVGGEEDYVLAFEKVTGGEVRYAAWTTAEKARPVVIPTPPGRYTVVGHIGKKLPALTAGANGLSIVLREAPVYLVPEPANP
jgi:polysaccharide biosynthesis protein PslG